MPGSHPLSLKFRFRPAALSPRQTWLPLAVGVGSCCTEDVQSWAVCDLGLLFPMLVFRVTAMLEQFWGDP